MMAENRYGMASYAALLQFHDHDPSIDIEPGKKVFRKKTGDTVRRKKKITQIFIFPMSVVHGNVYVTFAI